MSWFSGLRARLHLLFARRAAESRMDGEIDFHIEMETSRLVRDEGLSPDQARRRARVAFGGVTQYREALRDGRGLAWLGGLSLDMKLGFRMLRKYPGVTLIGGLAMAFAIWAGAVTFEVVTLFVHPTMPLPGGDRIVRIQNWDLAESDGNQPTPHDFVVWRQALSSVTDVGTYRDVVRNLVSDDGDARPVYTAEITASAFRVAPIPPLLGRVLLPTDEAAGAPPVVVLGYDVWRNRFAADRSVIGRAVRVGDMHATVVGVMPAGFAFPVSHDMWIPLRTDALDETQRVGPGITVFGRLAPGVTFEAAQSELTTLGRRTAADFPDTHAQLEPRVSPYAHLSGPPSGTDRGLMFSIYFFALMLVVLVCSNVALLLFARAATREAELIVRSALGASRRRIVMQLFAEALLLGCVAAVVGLVAAGLVLRTWGVEFLELNMERVPFWYDPSLSPATVLYALGLTVLGAGIAGVLPALKITRGLGSRLRQGTAGGGGVQFGGVWTAVIISQVAVTVAFPAIVYVEQRELRRIQSFDVGFEAREYLGVELEMDFPAGTGGDDEAANAAQLTRYSAALEGMRRRMVAEPGVSGVTFVDRLPRMFHREQHVEVELPTSASGQTAPPHEVSIAFIDPTYFDVLNTPILAGRAFSSADLSPDTRVVIVDRAFVDNVLQGRNAIGRRMRFAEIQGQEAAEAAAPEPWHEIVGVVKDLGMTFMAHQHRAAGVYLPGDPARVAPLSMVVHARGDPMSLGPRVRQIAAAVDPTLRVGEPQRLDRVADGILWIVGMWLRVTVLLTVIAVVLSLAGIYAVLAFTVARRTREIGVRVALGATRRRLVAAIFRRPLTQVTLGVAAGALLIVLGAFVLSRGDGSLVRFEVSLAQLGVLLAYVTIMLAVCMLACVVPTRRALSVEPSEALRAD